MINRKKITRLNNSRYDRRGEQTSNEIKGTPESVNSMEVDAMEENSSMIIASLVTKAFLFVFNVNLIKEGNQLCSCNTVYIEIATNANAHQS